MNCPHTYNHERNDRASVYKTTLYKYIIKVHTYPVEIFIEKWEIIFFIIFHTYFVKASRHKSEAAIFWNDGYLVTLSYCINNIN